MALTLYYDTYASTGEASGGVTDLVLLHGWGMHSLVWDEVMPLLLKHFRVTVIDLPGMGRSPIPAGDYDLEYLAGHVLAVAPKQAVWLGWSLGGLVAAYLAIEHPARVQALVTTASTPCFVIKEDWPCAMPTEVMQGFSDRFLEAWEDTLIRFLALQSKGSDTVKDDLRQLKALVYFHGLPARKALQGGLSVLIGTDLRAALEQIAVPTLHIFGEHDVLIPALVAEKIKDYQPLAQTAVIKGASHLPFLSHPQTYVQAIESWLEKDCELMDA